MTREELIDCINDDINPRTCPEYSCNMPEEENNVGKCCRECAEKQLEDYEEKIRADERVKAERDFQNGDYWNEYLEKVIADVRADERAKIIAILDSADDSENAMYLLSKYLISEQLKEQKK